MIIMKSLTNLVGACSLTWLMLKSDYEQSTYFPNHSRIFRRDWTGADGFRTVGLAGGVGQ